MKVSKGQLPFLSLCMVLGGAGQCLVFIMMQVVLLQYQVPILGRSAMFGHAEVVLLSEPVSQRPRYRCKVFGSLTAAEAEIANMTESSGERGCHTRRVDPRSGACVCVIHRWMCVLFLPSLYRWWMHGRWSSIWGHLFA